MSDQIKQIRDSINDMVTLYGIEFTVYGVSFDRHIYLKYKDLPFEDVPEEYQLLIRILKLLEDMGFPMNEVGTYLYKMMIESIIIRLLDNIELNLLANLNNMYSQFYVDIARNDLDIGIKTFHKLIISSIEKIDYTKFNNSVIGSHIGSHNYASSAYLIAKHLLSLDLDNDLNNKALLTYPLLQTK